MSGVIDMSLVLSDERIARLRRSKRKKAALEWPPSYIAAL